MTTNELETDYLVVGAGAGAMAFTDELLTHSDATVTLVDRRSVPGGHWVDAYRFVRLHQPSAFYGVSSTPLGSDAVDTAGTNAGFHELASAGELLTYYERVMHRRFLPTGRVRYFPNCEYVGEHRFVSRLSGTSWRARVRRKLVDTTYLEGAIPATSAPPFEVAAGVRCVAPDALTRLDDRPERFIVVGAGKTALDACVWLLEQGVAPSAIRWIRPRDAWWVNRRFQQPHTGLPELYRGTAAQVEALAQADTLEGLFERLEAEGFFLRLDPKVVPTMFRGAVVSEAELSALRRIEDVVRLGHVKRLEPGGIVLQSGRVPTGPGTLHVHCAARGLARPPVRPIFEPGRVTLQPFAWGFVCYQFALLGVMEASLDSDDERNALCPPVVYWDTNGDYVTAFAAMMAGEVARAAHPALGAWMKATRLNPLHGLAAHRDDPGVRDSRERIKRFAMPAIANAQRLVA